MSKGLIRFIQDKNRVKEHTKLVDYLRNAIIENGGNYEDIKLQMSKILEFLTSEEAKKYNLSMPALQNAYYDFFEVNNQIKNVELSDKGFVAMYDKAGDEKCHTWSKRGVSVHLGHIYNSPILYFGERKKFADITRSDAVLMFGDDSIRFNYMLNSNYDEIPLMAAGTQAEFKFDDSNNLTGILMRSVPYSKIPVWSDPIMVQFEGGKFDKDNQSGIIIKKVKELRD